MPPRNEDARWRDSVDRKLEALSEKIDKGDEAAAQHRDGLKDVIGALSMAVRDLTNKLAEQASRQGDKLDEQAKATTNHEIRLKAIETLIAEGRGMGRLALWLKGLVVGVIGALAAWILRGVQQGQGLLGQ